MALTRAQIQELASKGRGGDTMLAHINPQEAALLKAHGGSGTINPNTGLPEYRFGGFLTGGVKSVAAPVVAPVEKAASQVTSNLANLPSSVDDTVIQPTISTAKNVAAPVSKFKPVSLSKLLGRVTAPVVAPVEKAASQVTSNLANLPSSISNTVSQVPKAVEQVADPIVSPLEKAAGQVSSNLANLPGSVENTVKQVAEPVKDLMSNPLFPVVASFAFPIAGQAIGSMLLSEGVLAAGTSQLAANAIGNAIASAGLQVASGVPLEKAITNASLNAAISINSPSLAKAINEQINNPTMTNLVVNAGANAAKAVATGQDPAKAIEATAMFSAVGSIASATPGYDQLTKTQQANFNHAVYSVINGQDPTQDILKTAIGAGINAVKSGGDQNPVPTNPFPSPLPSEEQPTDLSEFIKKTPIDTSFGADYSLSAPDRTGIKISPFDVGADVGYSPVDYSFSPLTPDQYDGGAGLQMPTSSALPIMGGAQGLTVPTELGIVGSNGLTPTGAVPVLGDPTSFINDPSITGVPIITQGPSGTGYDATKAVNAIASYLNSKEAPLSQRTTGLTGLRNTQTMTPIDETNKIVDVANIMPTGDNGDPTKLAQLQQMNQSIVPSLAKVLMARGLNVNPVNFAGGDQYADASGITPEMMASLDNPYAKGGKVSQAHRPEFVTGKTGHYAQGRGTGQSDDIPAVLHDGDYVVDADTVAAFGDGSSKAGAGALEQFRRSIPAHQSGGGQPIRAQIADGEYVLPAGFVTSLGQGSNKHGAKMLDAMREQIRSHKRSAPDTKIPPKAKSPLQYMREAMKG